MNRDLGLKMGQALTDLTRRLDAFEAKAKTPAPEPLLGKMVDELAGQINSASDQASLSQLDTQKAIAMAAKTIADALDRNTQALKGQDDGKEKPQT